MKTIRDIYISDLKGIGRNFFAIVVAVGVLFLAALYAWANIYSNWDPYGSTGGMKLAAISLDEGFINDEGEYINVGQDVIDDLHESDSIDWQFVETADDAREGVETGEYYAALIIEKDFSYNMYHVFTEDVEKPQLIFYQNQKKNPVATKISDTVVGNIQAKINNAFVKAMTEVVFEDANDLYEDIDEEGGIDGFIDRLKEINEDLNEYQNTIDTVIEGNRVLSAAVNEASDDVNVLSGKTEESGQSIADASSSLQESHMTLATYKEQVDLTIDTIQTTLTNMEERLNKAVVSGDLQSMQQTATDCYDDAVLVSKDLTALSESLSESDDLIAKGTLEQLTKNMNSVSSTLDKINVDGELINATDKVDSEEQAIAKELKNANDSIENIQKRVEYELIPQMDATIDGLQKVMDNASSLMYSMSDTFVDMGDVFDAIQITINSADTSLLKTKEALSLISERLTKTIDKVDSVANDEKVEALLDTLSGDPDKYGEFFSEPVEIETTEVYEVENYGSAVAPFYTILAIWVGGTILVSILKVHPDHEKYHDAKPYELYFGRYLLFFTMAQLQNLIIVLGDLLLLKIQCLHPFLFWFAGFMAATTFSLLIYSLTVSFGDVGKAAAVVVLVLQIAGSSGTYPIELLPEFFQNVYIFFPFPYAINAMREAIAGLYEMDYVVYLLQESLFIVAALIVGLLIRKPFMGLNEYFEKRMEDTEML